MSKPIYLAGSWIETATPHVVRCPYDNEVYEQTWLAGPEELERALEQARVAFDRTRRLSPLERSTALERMAAELTARAEEVAHILSNEAGKPLKDARIEVGRGIHTLQISAREALRVNDGETMDLGDFPTTVNHSVLIRRFPIGPIAGIVPFNFPLNLALHKVGPALAAGNPIIIKPASQTPFSNLLIAELFDHSGYPKDALSVLPMTREVGDKLYTDPRIVMLSFTGSAEVGWAMKEKVPQKKVVLELGGNAAVIVDRDAPIASTAAAIAKGGCSYAGQSCISVQRVFVHDDICEEFQTVLAQKISELSVGDPRLEVTDVGSVIDDRSADRLEKWIEEARADGAKILVGGTRNGRVIQPTLVATDNQALNICAEEAFGPVVVVSRYSEQEEVIARINGSRYGLQAAIFTHDQGFIDRAYRDLEVGGLIVNNVTAFRADQMPYGGVKDSGVGREGPFYAIQEMMEIKVLVTKHDL